MAWCRCEKRAKEIPSIVQNREVVRLETKTRSHDARKNEDHYLSPFVAKAKDDRRVMTPQESLTEMQCNAWYNKLIKHDEPTLTFTDKAVQVRIGMLQNASNK